jgi:hypothetical protein
MEGEKLKTRLMFFCFPFDVVENIKPQTKNAKQKTKYIMKLQIKISKLQGRKNSKII